MGVADLEEFQECLHDELQALEAANIHAILGSGPQVGEKGPFLLFPPPPPSHTSDGPKRISCAWSFGVYLLAE
jgi:hypothetical protein